MYMQNNYTLTIWLSNNLIRNCEFGSINFLLKRKTLWSFSLKTFWQTWNPDVSWWKSISYFGQDDAWLLYGFITQALGSDYFIAVYIQTDLHGKLLWNLLNGWTEATERTLSIFTIIQQMDRVPKNLNYENEPM